MQRAFLLLIGALAGCLLQASEPWKQKKYTEWTEKEIEKVLRDSPWARTVAISLSAGTQAGRDTGRRRRGGGGFGGSGTSGADAEGETGGVSRSPSDDVGGAARRELRVLVRWQTALPVRQALAQQQLQAEKITPEQAEQFVSRATDRYVVMLTGVPMGAMIGATPEAVKAATLLKAGDGKQVSVEDVRMSQGRMPELFFVFPRAALPLDLASKSVEFVTKLGRLEIKKKFSLKEMLVDGKLEL